MTVDGTLTDYPLPTQTELPGQPGTIISGPDGALWYTHNYLLGRMTVDGQRSYFPLPDGNPLALAVGIDRNLWVAEAGGVNDDGTIKSYLARVTPLGVALVSYRLPDNSEPTSIATDSLGNVWFTETNRPYIGRLDLTGVVTEYKVSAPAYGGGIVLGADGNMWFSEPFGDRLGRVTPAGDLTEYQLPPNHYPVSPVTGPDGNVWFTDDDGNPSQVGKITPAGVTTEYTLPTCFALAGPVAVGPDRKLWVAEQTSLSPGPVGFAVVDPAAPPTAVPDCSPMSDHLRIATAPGPGGAGNVRTFGRNGTPESSIDPGSTGGVSVAMGDVDGDGHDEIVTGAAPGSAPLVSIYRADGTLVRRFEAYDRGFLGGVTVAVADLEQNGRADIVTGARAGGGPHVKVFRPDGVLRTSFFAYDAGFVGGVNVSAALVDRYPVDKLPVIVTGAGPGGGPDVRLFSPTGATEGGFYAYESGFHGGVSVGVGSYGRDVAIVTGPGPGGGPLVKWFDAHGNHPMAAAYVYDPEFHGGVNVSFFSETDNYAAEVVVGPGPGGGPHVRRLNFGFLVSNAEFFAYDASLSSGLAVAAGHD